MGPISQFPFTSELLESFFSHVYLQYFSCESPSAFPVYNSYVSLFFVPPVIFPLLVLTPFSSHLPEDTHFFYSPFTYPLSGETYITSMCTGQPKYSFCSAHLYHYLWSSCISHLVPQQMLFSALSLCGLHTLRTVRVRSTVIKC